MTLEAIQVVIPARDERETIGHVIGLLRRQGLDRIRVVDNGSSDDTAAIARQLGAEVISEPRPGYGRACWAGCLNLDPAVQWLMFCDGDGGDPIEELPRFLALLPDHDLLLGDRTATAVGRASLTPCSRGQPAGHHADHPGLGLPLPRHGAAAPGAAQGLRGDGPARPGLWLDPGDAGAGGRAGPAHPRGAHLPAPAPGRRFEDFRSLGASLQAGWVILTTLGRLWLRRWR